MDLHELRRRDTAHIWHPYTDIDQFEAAEFPVIASASGSYIYDTEGKKYLDAIASWWCVNFGHSHPELLASIQEQAAKLQNVILAGMSHPKAIELAEKLRSLCPEGLNHAYFASDGASAVEAALRMALQYWANIGQPQRTKFVSLEEGYHGDTLGTINVGYVESFHKELKPVINENFRAISPHCAQCPFNEHPASCAVPCFASMQEIIEKEHKQIAAVIVEPLCQGAGGIRIYPEGYLQKLRKTCDEYGLLLICDEIAVGFGRTGAMFAVQRAGICPDIMTVGKGLTGGYLPMSAALATDEIYNSFRGGKTFFHGHTYCGNPIVSALALRALELYEEEAVLERIQPLSEELAKGIHALQKKYFPKSFAHSLGMIAAIELSEEDGGSARARRVKEEAQAAGLLIRPLGKVVYLWPPLLISSAELGELFEILDKACQLAQTD